MNCQYDSYELQIHMFISIDRPKLQKKIMLQPLHRNINHDDNHQQTIATIHLHQTSYNKKGGTPAKENENEINGV